MVLNNFCLHYKSISENLCQIGSFPYFQMPVQDWYQLIHKDLIYICSNIVDSCWTVIIRLRRTTNSLHVQETSL